MKDEIKLMSLSNEPRRQRTVDRGFSADGLRASESHLNAKKPVRIHPMLVGLHKSSNWFTTLAESVAEGLAIVDDNGLLTYLNPAIGELFGVSTDDMLGRPIENLFEDIPDGRLLATLHAHAKYQAEPYSFEVADRQGMGFSAKVTIRALLESEGHRKSYLVIVNDQSDCKRHQTELSKYSKALEQSPVGVMITDKAGKVEYANPKLCALTGYASSDLVGQNARLLQSGQTTPDVYHNLWSTIVRGDEWRGELRDKRRNGEVYWASETISSIKDPQGDITHFIALHEDVTDRKAAEASLIESEAKYNLLVENSLTGIFIVQEGRLAYCNRMFLQQFGYELDELEHREFVTLIHPDDQARMVDLDTATLMDLNGSANDTVRGIRKDGAIVHLKRSCTPIWYKGKPALLQNTVDITVEKEMESRLADSAKQLQQLSEKLLNVQELERKRVACELHDGIGQYLSAMKFAMHKIDPALLSLTGAADQGSPCDNLLSLVKEAIEETRRIAADLRPSILDDLGIIATINWHCRRFQTLHADLHIDKQVQIEEQDVPEPLKLIIFRVIQEAMNNAVKHAAPKSLTVSLSKNDRALMLSIADDGTGFDQAVARLSDAPDRGLGLISMRERVLLSGGCLNLESSLGAGTRLLAHWPRIDVED